MCWNVDEASPIMGRSIPLRPEKAGSTPRCFAVDPFWFATPSRLQTWHVSDPRESSRSFGCESKMNDGKKHEKALKDSTLRCFQGGLPSTLHCETGFPDAILPPPRFQTDELDAPTLFVRSIVYCAKSASTSGSVKGDTLGSSTSLTPCLSVIACNRI